MAVDVEAVGIATWFDVDCEVGDPDPAVLAEFDDESSTIPDSVPDRDGSGDGLKLSVSTPTSRWFTIQPLC